MGGFERRAHALGVAGAVELVMCVADQIALALCHVCGIGDDTVADFLRDEMIALLDRGDVGGRRRRRCRRPEA